MSTLLEEFKSITQALNDAGIEYAVCGGWAMAIHGLPRATMDIDLLVLADDLDEILRIAKDKGFDVEGLPLHFDVEIRRVPKIDRELKRLITLDLLLVTDAIKDVWQTRRELSWDEGITSVVSRDGLIKMKLLAGRKWISQTSKNYGRPRMKVDMSPAAITGRLRAMDELWLLSVKLMNSVPTGGHSLRARRSRALAIQDSIREVLFNDWDPIGVNVHQAINDEYDAYIAPLYRILVGTRSEGDLIDCLSRIERDEIGIGPAEPEGLKPVAKKLLKLKVTLD